MDFTKSIVGDAAPKWLGDVGYAIGHRPHQLLIRGLSVEEATRA
jgi:hypothetical protein